MIVAAIRDTWVAAPVSFVGGLVVGLWLGARFDIRKKRDV